MVGCLWTQRKTVFEAFEDEERSVATWNRRLRGFLRRAMRFRSVARRCLFLLLLLVLLFIARLYFNSRPDYALYNTLSSLELATSRQLIADAPSNKYVLFKQLQGAGFNNQVSQSVSLKPQKR